MVILTKQNDKINEIIKEMFLEISKDYKKISESKEFELEFDYYFKHETCLYINKLQERMGLFTKEGKYEYLTSAKVNIKLLQSFDKLVIEHIDYEHLRKVFLYALAVYGEYYNHAPDEADLSVLMYEGNKSDKLERLEYYRKFINICVMFYLTTFELELADINNIDDDSDYRIKRLFNISIPSVIGDFIKLDINPENHKTVTFTINTIKDDLVFNLFFKDKKEEQIRSILVNMVFKQNQLIRDGSGNTVVGFNTNVRDFLLNDNERALIIKYSKKKNGIKIILNHSNGVLYHFIPSNLIKAYSEKEKTYPSSLPLTIIQLKGEDNIELPCTVYELALAD